jgi:hypothetical protein
MGFRDLTTLQRRYAGQAGQPVNTFYVPVLSQATRYDRQAGYFDSATLVQLASGLAAFIRRVRDLPPADWPVMRLITGATWSPEDIAAYQRGIEALHISLDRSLVRHFAPSEDECIRLGLPPGWRPEEDQIARQRFGTLVWAGLLDVRIALPLDDAGRPYHPGRHGALYHPKAGGLTVHGKKTASSSSPVTSLRAQTGAPISSPSCAHGMRCWWTKRMRHGAGYLEADRISCSACCRRSVPGAWCAASGC